MAYESECDRIETFIEQVDELIGALEDEDMASEYFASQIESVKDAKMVAERELSDIRDGSDQIDVDDALREARRVKNKLDEAMTDIDDCLTALGE